MRACRETLGYHVGFVQGQAHRRSIRIVHRVVRQYDSDFASLAVSYEQVDLAVTIGIPILPCHSPGGWGHVSPGPWGQVTGIEDLAI